jgi:hypothetical protein
MQDVLMEVEYTALPFGFRIDLRHDLDQSGRLIRDDHIDLP